MKINIELNLKEIEYLRQGLRQLLKNYEVGCDEWKEITALHNNLLNKELKLLSLMEEGK